jgi:hypothetical protein
LQTRVVVWLHRGSVVRDLKKFGYDNMTTDRLSEKALLEMVVGPIIRVGLG